MCAGNYLPCRLPSTPRPIHSKSYCNSSRSLYLFGAAAAGCCSVKDLPLYDSFRQSPVINLSVPAAVLDGSRDLAGS